MNKWIEVNKLLPKPYVTVLTQHEDDLSPVAACIFPAGYWIRCTEGPEDAEIEGNHIELYRSPTHWMRLPDSPRVAEEAETAKSDNQT